MKQNKKIFLPWYKKKNRGRDKWNRFENWKQKTENVHIQENKAKYPRSDDKRKRK